MAKEKKYRYKVSFCAEDDFSGTIELTKREAEVVAYATDTANWKNGSGGGYCGTFVIDLDNPMEIDY